MDATYSEHQAAPLPEPPEVRRKRLLGPFGAGFDHPIRRFTAFEVNPVDIDPAAGAIEKPHLHRSIAGDRTALARHLLRANEHSQRPKELPILPDQPLEPGPGGNVEPELLLSTRRPVVSVDWRRAPIGVELHGVHRATVRTERAAADGEDPLTGLQLKNALATAGSATAGPCPRPGGVPADQLDGVNPVTLADANLEHVAADVGERHAATRPNRPELLGGNGTNRTQQRSTRQYQVTQSHSDAPR